MWENTGEKRMKEWILSFISVILIVSTDSSHHADLTAGLFDKYDKGVKPVCDGTSEQVNVTLDVALRQMVELDEPKQILRLNIWVRLAWKDCRLAWNESDNGGIKHVIVPKDRVWLPDITLYDSVSLEDNTDGFRADIASDGTVKYNYPILTESRCTVDVEFFPFDSQTCKLIFGSWAYNGNEIDLISKNEGGDLTSLDENIEWEILEFPAIRHVKTYKCCPEPYLDVTFYVELKRKPSFYVSHMILPCILISAIGILGFILPPEAGEKVAVGITVLLSQAVFLLLVGEKLPPSSESLPLIAMYFDLCMFLVCFACVVSVVVLNLHYRTSSKFPPWARLFLLNYLAKFACVKTPSHTELPTDDFQKTNRRFKHEVGDSKGLTDFPDSPGMRIESSFQNADNKSNISDKNARIMRQNVNNNEDIRSETAESKHDEKSNEDDWKLLATIIDRVGMIIYIVGFLVSTITFLALFKNHSDQLT